MTVTALIADDEPVARTGLRDLLGAHDWLTVVGEAASGPKAAAAIDTLKPDVAFVDVSMPGFSGVELLRRIVHQPYVVFTTAYAEHAVTAFELGAIDYLLKPFGAERLAAALDRVRAALGEPVAAPAADRLADALAGGPMSRLFVRSGGSIIPVPVERISRFDASGDYAEAVHERGRYVVHISLARLEARLDPAQFVRVHRGHIVNMQQVVAFRRQGKGQLVAEMRDGARIPVSRAKSRELRDQGV